MVALLVGAGDMWTLGLRVLLNQVYGATFGTRSVERLIPGHKIAVGVIAASVENFATAASTLTDVAVAILLGAIHAGADRTCVLAVGVRGTGEKFPARA